MTADEISKCIPHHVIWTALMEWFGEPDDAGDELYVKDMTAAIAAGLAAWKGAEQTELCGGRSGPALILPLSQERAADLNEGDDELLWRRD